MISTSDIEEVKKLIKKEKKPIIVRAQGDKFNRKILEHGNIDILLFSELSRPRGSLRQIDSGLNRVLANIAKKNKVEIGIDIEEIRSLSKKEKAERIIRILQNLRICRKAKLTVRILNPKKEDYYLLLSWGSPTKQAREATSKYF